MGEDGQLCAVLLGWAALLLWHSIVSGWWSSRPQRCKDACGGSESCGEDCIRLCVLVHTGCTRQNRFGDTDGETDGLCCRCGGPGLLRAQEGQSRRLKTGNYVESGGAGANKGAIAASTLYLLLAMANVCCWAVCGLSTCAIFRQGSTRTNTTPVRFNVGLLVEAGDGGGGAPVPGSCSLL